MSVEIINLTHIYMPGTPFACRALDDVTCTIEDGSFVGLIGHTGSGKSTLIQHINGLMKPTSGHIRIDGVDITDPTVSLQTVRTQVGLVFQYPEYQLFEETVLKDVMFGPKNLGLTEEAVRTRAEEALTLLGIPSSLWNQSPFELSGGQKRRVAIAGVVAMRPKILILDEPAAGLDPVGRREMRALMADIHRTGTTVIMVSHSMDDVAALCDRVIVMHKGKVALSGTPAEIFAHGDRLTSMGLGLPETARLRDLLNQNGWNIPTDVFELNRLAQIVMDKQKRSEENGA